MKKIFIAFMLCLPLLAGARPIQISPEVATTTKTGPSNLQTDSLKPQAAQSNEGWSVPDQPTQKKVTAKKEISDQKGRQEKTKLKEDPKYLAGAVPVDQKGHVVFTVDINAEGKTKGEIYDLVYNYLSKLTTGTDQLQGSRIALVNKDKGTIAATVKEWLVFQNTFLSLDRTKFFYTLIAECSDHHLKMTMRRISYTYEEDRSTGFTSPAEELITDNYALTKKKNDLSRIYGKFRKKTIDRKDKIFGDLTTLLNQ